MEGMKGERGISDVLSIAMMLLIAILSGTLLHSYGSDTIPAANGRQLQMRVEYAYKVLELSQMENSSLTYLEAISENLVMENLGAEAIFPGDYTRERVENVLGSICPQGYGLELELKYRGNTWLQRYPPDLLGHGEYYEFSGKVTLVVARVKTIAQVDASLKMFPVM